MNATPERPENDKSKAPQVSRLERMRRDKKDDDYMPELPPVEGGEYLLGYLFEVGPTMAAGMGAAPVTHTEIAAWCGLTGIVLHPWEARFLRRLSLEYVGENHRAEKLGCAPPWNPGDIKPEPSALKQSIRSLANL